MYITFLIGNGFDLNLGLKTRYTDFYLYFRQHAKADNMILGWIDEDEKLWSDLEMQLGSSTARIQKETLGKYYEDKIELDELLMEYLEEQQKKFIIAEEMEKKFAEELAQNLKNFQNYLSPNAASKVNEIENYYKSQRFTYQFITYNYTDCLDRLVNVEKKMQLDIGSHTDNYNTTINNRIGEVHHIHGTINREAIIGVNDEEQIANQSLRNNALFKDTFIKSRINEEIGQDRVVKAKAIIRNSHIICVYGMSLGATDKMWWEILVEQLVQDQNTIVIVFWKNFDSGVEKRVSTRTVLININIKNMLCDLGKGNYAEEILENIKSRIFVVINSEIFTFTPPGTV